MKKILFANYLALLFACDLPNVENPSLESIKSEVIMEDFDTNDLLNWNIVNDTVMGGASQATLELTNDKYANFSGFLSLENNGGFCSVRTYPKDLGLNRTQGFLIKVLGDGRSYSLNARSCKTRGGVNYRANFATTKGKITEVWVPFKDFKPSWRGSRIKNLPTLKGGDIEGIGFFLGDKKPGVFKLEIVKIVAMYKHST